MELRTFIFILSVSHLPTVEALPIQEMHQLNSNLHPSDDNLDSENVLNNVTSPPAGDASSTDSSEVREIFAEIVEAMVPNISASSVPEKEFLVGETKLVLKSELLNETEDGEYIEEDNESFDNPDEPKQKLPTITTPAALPSSHVNGKNNDKDGEDAERSSSELADEEDDMRQFYESLTYEEKQQLECIINLFITLFGFQFDFPEAVKVQEPDTSDSIIIGIQCLFFDCRKALPEIPTKPSLIDEAPSWPIRRARAGGNPCW